MKKEFIMPSLGIKKFNKELVLALSNNFDEALGELEAQEGKKVSVTVISL